MTFSHRRRKLAATILGTVAVLAGLPAGAGQAAPAGGGRVALDAAPAWTAHAEAIGPSRRDAQVSLTAVLPPRDEAAARRLAVEVSTPGTRQYRRYLTAAQWRARFAPPSATVRAVKSWLVANGFTITSVPANHRYVAFQGTVAMADAAFGVRLTDYVKDGVRTRAPSAPVAVPAALAGQVVGIGGLDGAVRVRPGIAGDGRASTLPPPAALFRNAPPCSAYYGEKVATTTPDFDGHKQPYAVCGYLPAQLRSAYGSQEALSAGMDGRGSTVAIVDAYASPTLLADAQTYARLNDPRHPLRSTQFRQVLPAAYAMQTECGAADWYAEQTLDVEAVHATAPAADILYVGSASCSDTAMTATVNTIVDNELAQVINNSYGLQGDRSPADSVADHESFLQAAAEGISVLFSSGDSGDDAAATGTRQPSYPAADPFVTAVGGTTLKVDQNGSYAGEAGWGTSKLTLENGSWTPGKFLYGSGGGTSALWRQPAYQDNVVPAAIAHYAGMAIPGRAIPDVAMVGDPNSGFRVGQTQTFPDGSLHYSEYRLGGTSLAAPLFAGLQAVANQVAGQPLGLLNPRLYQLAGTTAYHDIADPTRPSGGIVRVDYINNQDTAKGTVTTLRTVADTGTLFTRPGYDDVTGLGTPNGTAYLTAVSGRPLP